MQRSEIEIKSLVFLLFRHYKWYCDKCQCERKHTNITKSTTIAKKEYIIRTNKNNEEREKKVTSGTSFFEAMSSFSNNEVKSQRKSTGTNPDNKFVSTGQEM